ncbi:shikimate kinase AroK [Salicola sp. Rm-C-2C1-2]|uniref:shikimate kinase AroK n=1 Tax=Salicola sp. Rm-C-2C1-2 TaxID=3141321 RepID=UPI0032E3F58A
MALPERIILVGPMGAGKSTVGRQLARSLGYRFYDTDRVLEERTGADIPWIFDMEGEAGFRDRESRLIDELLNESGIVLATGGGAVLRPENRQRMTDGCVIYLRVTPDLQYERTRMDRNRPLLQNPDPRGVLERLFEERDPLYREIADFAVEGSQRGPRHLVRYLSRALEEPEGHVHATEAGSSER